MLGRRISFHQNRKHPLSEQRKIDTEPDQYLRAIPLAFSDQPEEEVFGANVRMAQLQRFAE